MKRQNKTKEYFKKAWHFVSRHNAPVIALELAIFVGVVIALAAEPEPTDQYPSQHNNNQLQIINSKSMPIYGEKGADNNEQLPATIGVPVLAKNEVFLKKLQQKLEQAQEIKSKYQLDGASLKRIVKADQKDRIVVEIGNKDGEEFSPEIKLSRWDEVDFKIIPNLGDVATIDKDLTFEGEKIKLSTPKVDYEMYEYTEGEGGYKFIWYLNEKPLTNKVEFIIETSGSNFFYQPALDEEYPESENCSPTECDTNGDGELDTFRPENVVGSYVVYHESKQGDYSAFPDGKNYRTGQAFFIYRPHIIDSNGAETWGILNIDIEKGIYSVEIPQDFLDKAAYPIKSNDTFGYETAGGSSTSVYNTLYGWKFDIPADGTATNITFYAYTGEPLSSACFIIYDATTRIDYSEEFSNANWSAAWHEGTCQVGASLLTGTYTLGFFTNTSFRFYYNTDWDNWQNEQWDAETYIYPPPATWAPSVPGNGRKFSVYCTYTTGGAPASWQPRPGGVQPGGSGGFFMF